MTISPIKREVPIPPRGQSQYSAVTKAITEMKPGDYREMENGNVRNLAKFVLAIGQRSGFRITTRKLNGTGLGIWRVK